MSIPVQYASFKSAGIYRLVYDRSTILNEDAEILRLVVGYSDKGPFNTPVYVKSASEFKAWFGDISKKLEKRGDYFHRIALQALNAGPILCLNLKPFDDEKNRIYASSIDTDFGNNVKIITKDFPVRDIYDRTKFWVLDSEKLDGLFEEEGLDRKYIHIAATDSTNNSASYFIRKASGQSVAGYNITVSDWYKSTNEEIPEYLEKYSNAKISDFFAEIYLFSGKFEPNQVFASDALKQYFTKDIATGELQLKPFITNPYGDAVDTLDALFNEELASPLGHYVGCLIPEFKDKMGVYRALDIIFNNDVDNHRLMMSFNDDLLYDDTIDVNINLSGFDEIFNQLADETLSESKRHEFIDYIFAGRAASTLLGNSYAPVTADKMSVKDDEIINESLNAYLSDRVFDTSVVFLDTFNNGSNAQNTYWHYSPNSSNLVRWECDASYGPASYCGFLTNVLSSGDSVIGYSYVADDEGEYSYSYGPVFVQDCGYAWYSDTYTYVYYVDFSGFPIQFDEVVSDTANSLHTEGYLVRLDNPINQEIGELKPIYLKGYDYPQGKPEGSDMLSKLNWQNTILGTINAESGIHTALLNKSNIDYRYIVDGFESFVDTECKSKLSFLAKEKESCFAILNFPAVRTFVKCPYASFVNDKGVFNVQYIVDGANKKKATTKKFSLPTETDGASYCAFYTSLRFSDGYVDEYLPSAGLVSNLFMEKYKSRQPYYIIAGPNYAQITASNLVGPDYNFSREELNIIEPYGVNCMVYRPSFGTFINANQTAKQTPKSALSSVNVRELVIYLQDEIEKVLQSYQWEFNNAVVRQAIKDKADYICEKVKANGGLQAYINVMDESNNTPDIIDNEMAVLSTSIEPGRGMGKMIHELTIYRTGALSALITES